MGHLTRADATQIWAAAINHSQAALDVHDATQWAKLTGSDEAEEQALKADQQLTEYRDILRYQISRNLGEEDTA